MFNRRRLARERLEYYLVYLILAYWRLILVVGLLLLVYAIATMFINPLAGATVPVPAIFLLLLSNSYNAAVYTARLGAWIGTLWMHDNERLTSIRITHQRQLEMPTNRGEETATLT